VKRYLENPQEFNETCFERAI
jgi:hypothetical protein